MAVHHIGPECADKTPHVTDESGEFQRILGIQRHSQRAQSHFLGLGEGFRIGQRHDAAFMPRSIEQTGEFQPIPRCGVEPTDIDDLNRTERRHGHPRKRKVLKGLLL